MRQPSHQTDALAAMTDAVRLRTGAAVKQVSWLLLAVLCAGCQQGRPDVACNVPPPGERHYGPDLLLDRCVRRAAAELSNGHDSAPVVAGAVASMCAGPIIQAAAAEYRPQIPPGQRNPQLVRETIESVTEGARTRALEEILRRRSAGCPHVSGGD